MAVGSEEVFIIFLIIILIISVVFGIYPVFSKFARNKCILQQHTLLNTFEKLIELVKERGEPIKDHDFLVMSCTDCIWYDSLNSQWVIKHVNEPRINKSIPYNVIGVAQNCLSCKEPEINDVECANMVKDHTYHFEIGENYVKCLDCPDSPNLCDYPILFSSRIQVGDDVYDPSWDSDDSEPIALVSYKNTLYLFYHKELTKHIYYKTSADGISWDTETQLTFGTQDHGFPSATVFNDELYVGYSEKTPGWEVFLKKFDGTTWTDVGILTDGNGDNDGGSYLAVYNGRLYLFFHHHWNHHIKYKSCSSNCGVQISWGVEQEAVSSGTNVYPSAIEHDEKLYLSYSKIVGDWEIYYKSFDGSSWSTEERITDTENIDGHSHLIVYDNRLYVFYHETTGSSVNDDSGSIFYKAYDGGWQRECGAAGGKKPNLAVFPAPTINSGKLNLCYIKYDGDWKIFCQ